MTGKKQQGAPERSGASRGGAEGGVQHAAAPKRKQPPEGVGAAPGKQAQESPSSPPAATGAPPAGLDAARHAKAQKTSHEAELMRQILFPAMMAEALGNDAMFGSSAYRVYLERLIEDAGNPSDPVQRMMLEQLALAHFRIAQLQVQASHAKSTEGVKIYNSAASRLQGEFRRTALALHAYGSRVPGDRTQGMLKVYKEAQ
jgi:hypothetical protein